jgi:hypothetical protein
MGWLCLALGISGTQATEQGCNSYETGYSDVVRICGELHHALGPKERQEIFPRPALLNQVIPPCVQPGVCSDGKRNWRAVHISAAFVDFLNQLSHARAIDLEEQGYLKRFLAALAADTGAQPTVGLAVAPRSQTWSFDIKNHQLSHFNQMAGALLAIGMAEHYLGYYDKYAAQLTDGQNRTVPINLVLTESEWRKAVLAGAHNALSCGFGIDGLKVLLDAIAAMPTRPAWTLYFVPQNAQVAKVRRDLDKLEKKFFLLE